MKINVVTLENKAAGELELNDTIFGLTPRKDILQRVVEWQRAKARAGTHKTKTRAEVSGTGKKPFKQKGTGGARQGTTRGPHQEGGGRAHGPVVRSHEYSLNKKVRTLGLKHALSSKAAEGKLFVVDSLFITGAEVDASFAKAINNLIGHDVLPTQGANVYDILRHKELVLSKDAVAALEERLK
jgi:large subunit ribosomal protein L4